MQRTPPYTPHPPTSVSKLSDSAPTVSEAFSVKCPDLLDRLGAAEIDMPFIWKKDIKITTTVGHDV